MGGTVKLKTCRVCRETFVPFRPMQKVCSVECGVSLVQQNKKRIAERIAKRLIRDLSKNTRMRLELMKTIPDLIREADKAFCAYIRERDKGMPCICCGKTSNGWTRGGEWDGGHFRSRGAASHLRYDERNCHAQLKQCNRRAWDVAKYEANLIAKIGLEQVEDLKADNRTHKWTRDELRGIRDTYRAKLKELRK